MQITSSPSKPVSLILWCSAFLLLAYGLYSSTITSLARQSADLFAMWLAGEFMAMGQLDQIYPSNPDLFDMTTPSAWWPHVAATDIDARIYPYIYPPIWAKLMSWITPITTFAVFDMVMLIVHQTMLIATIYLAGKMCGIRGLTAFFMMALTYHALVLTLPIGLAMSENQPQILVSFLIVFAFERAQSGAPRAAGILLAFAAAIKVYPVLFVVIFAARRDWRAFGAFTITGAALGLTSIALAGWPLHAQYLQLLATLSKSVIVTSLSFSVDAFYAGIFLEDQLEHFSQPRPSSEGTSWNAIGKTQVWHLMSSIAQVSAIVTVGILAARRPSDPLILPFAVTLFALLSPLSWMYTYLPAFVFVVVLGFRLRPIWWGFAILMVIYFHPILIVKTLPLTPWSLWSVGVGGVVLMVVMLISFFWAVLRGDAQR